MPTIGASREEHRSTRSDGVRGLASDLQRKQQMRLEVRTCRVDVEVGERYVAGTRSGDQHVVNGRQQLVEEPPEPLEVRRVEGGDAAVNLETRELHTFEGRGQ